MNFQLKLLASRSHALWLAAALDPACSRFENYSFSVKRLLDGRLAVARNIRKCLPQALQRYCQKEPAGNTDGLQYARKLSDAAHAGDFGEEVFAADCRAMYVVGIHLESLLSESGAILSDSEVEEEVLMTQSLSRYCGAGYSNLIGETFERLVETKEPTPLLWIGSADELPRQLCVNCVEAAGRTTTATSAKKVYHVICVLTTAANNLPQNNSPGNLHYSYDKSKTKNATHYKIKNNYMFPRILLVLMAYGCSGCRSTQYVDIAIIGTKKPVISRFRPGDQPNIWDIVNIGGGLRVNTVDQNNYPFVWLKRGEQTIRLRSEGVNSFSIPSRILPLRNKDVFTFNTMEF